MIGETKHPFSILIDNTQRVIGDFWECFPDSALLHPGYDFTNSIKEMAWFYICGIALRVGPISSR
jgi:hypothetical protein